jgi:decaprenylphospho-beta-D-ribofuranose 2-oxidase
MSSPTRQRLHGWGRTNPTLSDVADVDPSDLARTIATAGPRGALARGLGRSYGDAAQNSGGLVLRLRGHARDAVLDTTTGIATIPAGASLDDLLRVIVPQGWFVPVTPGTRFVTIGGAIASDIHGKNHHLEGSFGNHVERITLMLADGSVVHLGRTERPALFWATIGGMGLTGVIVDASVRLLPIETSRMSVDTDRLPDLDALLAAMEEGDHRYRYSVAWVDLMAKGAGLGRSVLTRGDHATLAGLDAASRSGTGADGPQPLAYSPGSLPSLPPLIPSPGLINRLSVAAFNELWFRKAPRHRVAELQSIASFFHPLDAVGDWNRIYGRHGLVQYQFVVPFDRTDAMQVVIERLVAAGTPSFLAVLKRFGPGNDAPLSFPTPGWTLALDVPGNSHDLSGLLHGLDEVVLEAGGRHYMAKEAHTTPSVVRRGYPRLDEWKAVRRAVDPSGRWQSDLARRLDLV